MVTGLKEFIAENDIEIRRIGRLKFLVLYKAVRDDYGSWWHHIMKLRNDTNAYRPGTTVRCREWSIDRDDDCGPGLHVGTWEHARWFASWSDKDWSTIGGKAVYLSKMRIIEVLVHPKDVVCVPKPVAKHIGKIRCNCLRVVRETSLRCKPKRMNYCVPTLIEGS